MENSGSGVGGVVLLIWLAVMILFIAANWKIFVKAGQPGWAILIPFYNIIVFLKIIGKPAWWLVLLLIPFVNIVIGIITILALAKRFGKTGGFAVGMILLPIIFYPILGFGDAKYSAA
jgi:hypothetical protein